MNKEANFRRFSTNLDLVLDFLNPQIQIEPRYEDGNFICPIGFTIHSIDGLSPEFDDALTIEHSPPKSVGGKPWCLVRKDINNSNGIEADKMLLEYLKGILFKSGKGSIKSKLQMGLPRLKDPHASLKFDTQNRLRFRILGVKLKDHLDPSDLGDGFQIPVQFSIQEMNSQIKCILLKTAYLHAFKYFGYGLLFDKNGVNPYYQLVREQILNPGKEVVPIIYEIGEKKLLDGIAIVTDPIEAACLIVGYPLLLEGNIFWVKVSLPAPDSRGLEGLHFINAKRKPTPEFNFRFEEFQRVNSLENIDGATEFYRFWNKYRGWKY